MLKKYAQNMSFNEFEKSITTEMLNELSKMNISYNKAYSIFKDIMKESELGENDDMGDMSTIVKNIILDYTDEILAGEFSKYDSDWEA